MKKLILMVFAAVLMAGFSVNVFAGITAQECKDKALEAAKAVEAEGQAAIAKIADKEGPFVWGDGAGYVWIHSMDGIMVAHPMKPQLNGKSVLEMKDPNGTPLFSNMNDLVEAKGAGWVAYVWTKPGQDVPSPKVSFVTKAVSEGKTYVVGAGIYDVTKDDITKQFPGDAIYQE
jgi:signal transduction histidine kinase